MRWLYISASSSTKLKETNRRFSTTELSAFQDGGLCNRIDDVLSLRSAGTVNKAWPGRLPVETLSSSKILSSPSFDVSVCDNSVTSLSSSDFDSVCEEYITEDSPSSNISQNRFSWILNCFGCKCTKLKKLNLWRRTNSLRNPDSSSRHLLKDRQRPDAETARIRKVLRTLSVNEGFDATSAIDKRMARLLHTALVHRPYRNSDGIDCEDWQELGFSNSDVTSLGRDLNRKGCGIMGLLLMIFFAIEHNDIATITFRIVQNLSVTPPSLFGLFAANCSKWITDMCRTPRADPGVEELFRSVEESQHRKPSLRFESILRSWLKSRKYKQTDNDEHIHLELAEVAFLKDSPNALPSEEDKKKFRFGTFCFSEVRKLPSTQDVASTFRIPIGEAPSESGGTGGQPSVPNNSVDTLGCTNKKKFASCHDEEIYVDVVIACGYLYTYVMICFAKFWLENSVFLSEGEEAQNKLNNNFVEREFIRKFSVPKGGIRGITSAIQKAAGKVRKEYEKSGLRLQKSN